MNNQQNPYSPPPHHTSGHGHYGGGHMPPHDAGKGKGIASMVCGICSIVFSFIPFLGLGVAIAGLILSVSAARDGYIGGMRIAGLVCSIIGTVFGGFYTMIILGAVACAPLFWLF